MKKLIAFTIGGLLVAGFARLPDSPPPKATPDGRIKVYENYGHTKDDGVVRVLHAIRCALERIADALEAKGGTNTKKD